MEMTYCQRWYAKHRESERLRRKKFREENPDKYAEYRAKWLLKNPWFKHYHAANQRCRRGVYKNKGIIFAVTANYVKSCWFVCEAWKLQEPSIDRVDSSQGYVVGNIRFIERSENCRLGRLNGIIKAGGRK